MKLVNVWICLMIMMPQQEPSLKAKKHFRSLKLQVLLTEMLLRRLGSFVTFGLDVVYNSFASKKKKKKKRKSQGTPLLI